MQGLIRDLVTGIAYEPEHVRVDEVVRFEGDSDPDEQAVLFALSSPAGIPLGTYVSVFGPGIPSEDSEVVRRLGQKVQRP
jgi:hypothetical protein